MEKISKILAEIDDPELLDRFLSEILTTREYKDLSLRWQLLIDLANGETQRAIANKHGISLCKITRGSKILKNEGSVTAKLLNKLQS